MIAEWTVSGNDLRPRVDELQGALGAVDHPVDVPARARIDEGINPVEEHVAHVDDIRAAVLNDDVAVGMGRRHVEQRDLFAVGL